MLIIAMMTESKEQLLQLTPNPLRASDTGTWNSAFPLDDIQSQIYSLSRVLFPCYYLTSLIVTLQNFLQMESQKMDSNGQI